MILTMGIGSGRLASRAFSAYPQTRLLAPILTSSNSPGALPSQPNMCMICLGYATPIAKLDQLGTLPPGLCGGVPRALMSQGRGQPTPTPPKFSMHTDALQRRTVNTLKLNPSATGSNNIIEDVLVKPETLGDAFDGFAESAKLTMEVLSEIAKIHPFIQVVVTTFQLVISLDLKRRENDGKVTMVKLEMKSMMTVLFHAQRLKDIKDPKGFKPTGGLEALLAEIKEYITDAASLCEWYNKKSMLRKYLKSHIYETRLVNCASTFAEYGAKLQRALSIHTAIGIDTANYKLDVVGDELRDMHQLMREVFVGLDSPREKEIRDLIQSAGSPQASITDNNILQTLIDKSGENTTRDTGENTTRPSGHGNQNLRKLRKSLLGEFSEDVERALEQNLLEFRGKLDIQLREINIALARQGDRIIAFFSGGHEHILDPNIRDIWKEMGWKSTVKARHFVLALRDFYLSELRVTRKEADQTSPSQVQTAQLPSPASTPESSDVSVSSVGSDTWATAYVNVSYLQAISEAIDDDGSGFVNIREVNDFTTLRPQGWTVPQWVAFWAVGWKSSVSRYTDLIYLLLRKIYKLRDRVRSRNLVILDDYLNDTSFWYLEMLLRSTNRVVPPVSPELAKLRDSFCIAEEERLTKNLDQVSYNLDSPGTVALVTGPGRIERHNINVIQLARSHTLQWGEFSDSYVSLWAIFSVFNGRLQELLSIFKQMHIDPETHFKNYAFGMFDNSFRLLKTKKWDLSACALSSVWDLLPLAEGEDDDVNACPDNIPLSILKCGAKDPLELGTSTEPDTVTFLDDIPEKFHGSWAGFWISNTSGKSAPFKGLSRVSFEEIPYDKDIGSGAVTTFTGQQELQYVLSQIDETRQKVDFVVMVKRHWIRCIGTFDNTLSQISGYWYRSHKPNFASLSTQDGTDAVADALVAAATLTPSSTSREQEYSVFDPSINTVSPAEERHLTGTFQLSRTPASLARFRYSPEAFLKSPSKARWTFAMDSILHVLRRNSLAKPYVLSQLRDIRRFVELTTKSLIFRWNLTSYINLTDNEKAELRELRRNMPPSIDQFYHKIAVHLHDRLMYHWYVGQIYLRD
ncbi:hypothetical protein DXG01_010066 [Tephrocybe rancida]|nr:hypothetical protein DXG01_010066 [Tephrocybe rancida]